jgi:outer membrane protein W
MSDRLGWELGLTRSQNDVGLRIVGPGRGNVFGDSDRMTPFTLTFGPDIHLTPESRMDLYFGPVVAYVLYNDVAFELQGEWADVALDDNFAWGGLLGLDYPFGDQGWYLCGSVRYLDADADATLQADPTETLSLAVDPLMVAVGFGYRF